VILSPPTILIVSLNNRGSTLSSGDGNVFNPVWNKPVQEGDQALDPLGMNRVTDRLLNDLLMGITTVTPRARYYSFYTWVVYNIGKRRTIENFSQFRSEFYDLERAFMLACVAHEQDTNARNRNHNAISGSEKGHRVWKESGSSISMDFPYFGHKLGGYGQYYQGSIAKLGLTMVPEDAAFEQPTELGLKIAEAFGKVIEHTWFMRDISGKKKVMKEALLKFGSGACLCRLRDADADDRNVLTKLFFGTLSGTNSSPTTIHRRETLALILFCSDFAASRGFKLSDQHFLDMCYFGQTCGAGRAHNFVIPKALAETASMWKVFRAHDYLAYSCEVILSCFLEFLSEKPHIGGTLDDFLAEVASKELVGRLRELTKASVPNKTATEIQMREILNGITVSLGLGEFGGREVEASKEFDAKVRVSSSFSEFQVMEMLEEVVQAGEFNREEVYSPVCALLISIYIRFFSQHATASKLWRWMIKHTGGDMSPARFVNDFQVRMKAARFSLADFMERFTKEYVVEQAKQVYLEKSASIYSKPRSWFHVEGMFFKPDREYWARHRNTRFDSATTILEDLGLVKIGGGAIELSEDGKQLLNKLGVS